MRSGLDPSSPSGVRKPNSNRLDEIHYLARGTLNLIEANSAQPSANRLSTGENSTHKSSPHQCLLTYSQTLLLVISQSV